VVVREVGESTVAESFSSIYDYLEEAILPPLGWSGFREVLRAYRSDRATSIHAYADVLPLLTCLTAGGDVGQARPLAAAWVCYLLATQIFDDIQDGEGQDRIWNREGVEGALPLGLFAIGVAKTALANLQTDLGAQRAIWEAFGKVIALAAAAQKEYPKFNGLTVETYFQYLAAKTGLIFATGAWAGGRVATADEEVLEALYQYGLNLGIAGQIVDDCHDLADVDLPSGTLTLPVLYALSQKEHPAHSRLVAILAQTPISTDGVDEVTHILHEVEAIEWSLKVAALYQQKAIEALAPLPGNRSEVLIDYASSSRSLVPQ